MRHSVLWTGPFSNPPDDKKPAGYFHRFFPNSLIHVIVEQTNVYAVQSGSDFCTDACEIEQYLDVLIKTGLVHMPRYQMYWSKELCFPPVADVMSRNRFTDVTQYLHFSDNTKTVTNRDDPQYDRYYKVRPLLTRLRDACLLIEPDERMSVDEMIPYKGRNSLRQYIPRKPKNADSKSLLIVE